MTEPYRIADLPEKAFINNPLPISKVMLSQPPVFIEKIEWSEEYGPLWYLQGFPYPRKGRIRPDLTNDVDQVKKYIKNYFLFFGSAPIKYFLILFFPVWLPFSGKIIKKWFELYENFAHTILSRHFLKREWYSKPTREIYDVGTKVFRTSLGQSVVQCLCVILDADRPYLHRLMDIFQLINKRNAKKHPIREVQRLFKILSERDEQRGWKEIGFIISLTMVFSSSFRESFKECMELIDPTKFNFDEADLYYFLFNKTYGGEHGYKVLGLDNKQRDDLHKQIFSRNVSSL